MSVIAGYFLFLIARGYFLILMVVCFLFNYVVSVSSGTVYQDFAKEFPCNCCCSRKLVVGQWQNKFPCSI